MTYEETTVGQTIGRLLSEHPDLDPATSGRAGGSPRRRCVAGAARRSPRPGGLGAARTAVVVGLLFAAVSVYWGLGGTWLLDTVGGSLERGGQAGNTSVMLAVWAAVAVKIIAAVLPLLAFRRVTSPAWNRSARVLAWAEAAALTIYGLVLTTAGLLVQADVIHAANADHRALAWHAYLWDPWFLLWGLLVAAALLRSRDHRSCTPTHG